MTLPPGRLAGDPPCPFCGNLLTGFTAIERGTTPRPGDASVCRYCGRLCIFDGAPDNLTLRAPTIAEVIELSPNRDVQSAQVLAALMSGQAISCPTCRRVSWNLNDVKHKFCAVCGWHAPA